MVGLLTVLRRWMPLRRVIFATRLRRWSRRTRVAAFAFALAIALLLQSFAPGWTARVRIACVDVMSPLFRVAHEINSALFYHLPGFFQDWAQAYHHIKADEKTNDYLKIILANNDELQRENDELRKLLKASARDARVFITAQVIGVPADAWARQLLVAVRDPAEIHKDVAVLTAEGLVGRVVEAGGAVARVQTITDPHSRVPVVIQPSGVHAIAAGDDSDRLILLHQRDTSTITVGDRVLSSGYGGVFPSGVPVGRVVDVRDDQVTIEPYVNLWRLRFVRVAVPVQAKKQKVPDAEALQ